MATTEPAARDAGIHATVAPASELDHLDPGGPAVEIIRVAGTLDDRPATHACLQAAYRLAAADAAEWLLVDLAGITALAPGGVSAIDDFVATARRDHRRVFLSGLQPTLVRRLQHVRPAAHEALHALRRRRPAHAGPEPALPAGHR